MTWHERLSALDAGFLDLEDDATPMHVGAVAVFGGRPPSREELEALVASRLDRVPRYRQRLAAVPFGLGRPVWVDEPQLDLGRHVHRTSLPPGGGAEALASLAAELLFRRLDRARPLWELWLVEGLGRGRFALVSKTHHCMIDGVSGVDLASVLLDSGPAAGREAARGPRPVPAWTPRPSPGAIARAVDAVRDVVGHPLALVRGALSPRTEERRVVLELAAGLKPLLDLSRLGPAPPCSLNRPVGPGRRWEALSLDLATVKHARGATGGTVNDVLLAVVAGALRTLLLSRGEEPPESLRVLVPVSVRTAAERATHGNQVAAVFCPLPVGEPDPLARLTRVSRAMKALKESGQAVGARALTLLGDFAPPTLAARAARLQATARFYNLVVTNVPGPQAPLHLLGRTLLACHPAVPLAPGTTVGVALLSYNGSVDVGLLGDAAKTPDLALLAAALPRELELLASLVPGRPVPAGRSRRR